MTKSLYLPGSSPTSYGGWGWRRLRDPSVSPMFQILDSRLLVSRDMDSRPTAGRVSPSTSRPPTCRQNSRRSPGHPRTTLRLTRFPINQMTRLVGVGVSSDYKPSGSGWDSGSRFWKGSKVSGVNIQSHLSIGITKQVSKRFIHTSWMVHTRSTRLPVAFFL